MIRLDTLRLAEFKSHAAQSFQFATKLNSLVGLNGVGKTNILDAIHLLCLTKSHFSMPDNALIKHGADYFRVEGIFTKKIDEKQESTEKIVVKMAARKRKVIERNNVAYTRAAEHIGLLPTVMLSPDDPYLLLDGGSEERRNFLDKAISQSNHAYLQALITYQKIIEQRNALLKQANEQGIAPNRSLLSVYNEQLIAPVSLLYTCRKAWMLQFTPIFQTYYTAISGGNEAVSCVYESQLHEKSYFELLEQSYAKDCVLGRSTAGIHKDDLVFYINEYPLKRYASQGQMKSYILALKLAQSECLRCDTGIAPILLLDDIFDKLDAKRVQHLLTLLHAPNFGQLFVTDTDTNRIAAIAHTITSDFRQFVL